MPTTQTLESSHTSGVYAKRDLTIVRGQGALVWGDQGNRYIDCAAGHGVANLGHSHPKVVQAIQEQAAALITCPEMFYNPARAALLGKLTALAPPGMGRVFLSNSGTEAVEAAFKFARYSTGRSEIIAAMRGFHGRTMGSLAMTASKPKYRRGFTPLMGNVVHVPFPNTYHPVLATRPGEGYGEAVVRYIRENILGHLLPPDEVAGILIEPIQGEG
jgi:4-aminobutyrate aminotransferase-like enzyme